MKMKSREDLINEIIEMENAAMKFKKGLHLAKKFIDSHRADPDLSVEMIDNYSAYTDFLEENDLGGI